MLALCILSCSFLCTVCSKVSDSHACFVHSISLFSLHSLLKGFRLSHACFVHSISLFSLHSLLKGFRLSHACFVHSTSLFPLHSLLKGFRLPCLLCAFYLALFSAQFAQSQSLHSFRLSHACHSLENHTTHKDGTCTVTLVRTCEFQ